MKNSKQDVRINQRILKAIDLVMYRFGSQVRDSVYRYVERMGLPREEIPCRPGEFVTYLRRIFGVVAVMLEREIVRELAREFRIDREPKSLEEAVRIIHERLASQR